MSDISGPWKPPAEDRPTRVESPETATPPESQPPSDKSSTNSPVERSRVVGPVVEEQSGNEPHIPVMCREVVACCPDVGDGPDGAMVVVDATVGAGGHADAILRAKPNVRRFVGFDADPESLALAAQKLASYGSRVMLVHANFGSLSETLSRVGVGAVNYLVADLGLCSRQYGHPSRGFSFGLAGRLDMRLNPQTSRTAEEIVGTWDEFELADLLYKYGEERLSRRVARAIVQARTSGRLSNAQELADVIRGAYPERARRASRIDPATRSFQAVRMAVNDELGQLARLLVDGPRSLAVGGRMAVISFHSLEDRPLKVAFRTLAREGHINEEAVWEVMPQLVERRGETSGRKVRRGEGLVGRWAEGTDRRAMSRGGRPKPSEMPSGASRSYRLLNTKPWVADDTEVSANVRSRSAKLRVIERTA